MPSLTQNQSMNGAWIEAFKVGVHTDNSGKTDNWTPEKIDAFIAKYNPVYHEAPLRIDHVEPGQRRQNGPSFGWIEAAKRVGDTVYVKLSQVSRQFEDWVRQGLIKKRSIAFDSEKGIHHLAFLGYNCPAIPGMENIYSDGGKCIVIEEFSEGIMNENLVGQAASLVAEYNKSAGALAVIVGKLCELRKQLDDKNGNIIISGDGWNNNTLETIPMLRMQGSEFPSVSPAGKFFTAGNSDPLFFGAGGFSESISQKTAGKIVGAEEATNILEQKTAELKAKDTNITHQEAVKKAVEQLKYSEVPGTNNRFYIEVN